MIVHEETPQVAREEQPAPVCCHYWIIETAQGPISRGECQNCHEVRDFRNSVFDMDRGSQDNGYRKGPEAEKNGQQAAVSQVSEELDQDPDAGEPDPEESDMEEPKTVEPEVEEPEFVGVSED